MRCCVSLEVLSSAHNFGCKITCTFIKCMFNCIALAARTNHLRRNHIFLQYLDSNLTKKYTKKSKYIVPSTKKQPTLISDGIYDQFKSTIVVLAGDWLCKRCMVTNQQCTENINISWKLSRSILDKCRYTSLKLAVRSAALMAYPIARFRTYNLVKVGSSDNNKGQCQNLWHCQTIVDS